MWYNYIICILVATLPRCIKNALLHERHLLARNMRRSVLVMAAVYD